MDRSLCSIHGVNPGKCFWSHQPQGVDEVERVEHLMIVLPCTHLTDRPTGDHAIIECGCGTVWRVKKDASGVAWDAYEVTA